MRPLEFGWFLPTSVDTTAFGVPEETIDVGDRNRVSAMGRHLVTADAQGIQVVDATPWADTAVPAAAR